MFPIGVFISIANFMEHCVPLLHNIRNCNGVIEKKRKSLLVFHARVHALLEIHIGAQLLKWGDITLTNELQLKIIGWFQEAMTFLDGLHDADESALLLEMGRKINCIICRPNKALKTSRQNIARSLEEMLPYEILEKIIETVKSPVELTCVNKRWSMIASRKASLSPLSIDLRPY